MILASSEGFFFVCELELQKKKRILLLLLFSRAYVSLVRVGSGFGSQRRPF